MINTNKQKLNKHENLTLYFAMVSLIFAVFVAITFAPLNVDAECVHSGLGQAKHRELLDKRIGVLHSELRLSSEQEVAWTGFIEKSKSNEQVKIPNRYELSKLTTPERLERMLSVIKARQQNMEARAQSVKSFYSILTVEQQRIFDASFHAYGISMKNSDRSPLLVIA
jgi:Spy/CpxP family protein refolding chaperone